MTDYHFSWYTLDKDCSLLIEAVSGIDYMISAKMFPGTWQENGQKNKVVIWSTWRLHRVGKKGACTLLTALPTSYQCCWIRVKVMPQPTTCLVPFVFSNCPIFFRYADWLSNQWECEFLKFWADSIFSLKPLSITAHTKCWVLVKVSAVVTT